MCFRVLHSVLIEIERPVSIPNEQLSTAVSQKLMKANLRVKDDKN